MYLLVVEYQQEVIFVHRKRGHIMKMLLIDSERGEELFHCQLHIADATSPDGHHFHVIVLDEEEERWEE